MDRNFHDLLRARWKAGKHLCVGLDPVLDRIPDCAHKDNVANTIISFNASIVGATMGSVCAYKPNTAFYESLGPVGWVVLRETIRYIHKHAPGVPVILDFKRGDIGNTNAHYAKLAFEYLKADAVTVHPYLGHLAMEPFLDYKDKGIIVLVLTSNPGADEFQDILLNDDDGYHLSDQVASSVSCIWNYNGNCCVVAGATCPGGLGRVRLIVGDDIPILIPGIGAQGGDLEATVAAGKNSRGNGMIINSSRGIIFADEEGTPDFARIAGQAAEDLNNQILEALKVGG